YATHHPQFALPANGDLSSHGDSGKSSVQPNGCVHVLRYPYLQWTALQSAPHLRSALIKMPPYDLRWTFHNPTRQPAPPLHRAARANLRYPQPERSAAASLSHYSSTTY